ncbi:MAG: DNA replication/repair protein RecF [Rhodothermales bacterium]|nr:DNA replication/repair protein RecF [Rhodothermales bacterium]
MYISDLTLSAFRAHDDFKISFGERINLITGPNGIGKTNLLEAIHYLCLTKSFVSARDATAIREGSDEFVIRGRFVDGGTQSRSVSLQYSKATGKTLQVNKATVERVTGHVGLLPVVVFSPDDYGITAGGPEERRRFLDNMLCQASKTYLADLQNFRHALKQRNSLLVQATSHTATFRSQLDAWSSEVVRHGARVINRRRTDISLINSYLHDSLEQLGLANEVPEMRYRSVPVGDVDRGTSSGGRDLSLEEIEERYFEALVEAGSNDMARRRTSVGPHRDELELFVNGRPLRNYASQGQHRTFAMALKLAKYHYLYKLCETKPILLLDDAFDHLDPERIAGYIHLIQDKLECQAFITTANPGVIESIVQWGDPNRHFNLSVMIGALEKE